MPNHYPSSIAATRDREKGLPKAQPQAASYIRLSALDGRLAECCNGAKPRFQGGVLTRERC